MNEALLLKNESKTLCNQSVKLILHHNFKKNKKNNDEFSNAIKENKTSMHKIKEMTKFIFNRFIIRIRRSQSSRAPHRCSTAATSNIEDN